MKQRSKKVLWEIICICGHVWTQRARRKKFIWDMHCPNCDVRLQEYNRHWDEQIEVYKVR